MGRHFMKIYLSIDMEGITGLPDYTFVEEDKQHYERACWLMTAEANAIIESAFDNGATEVLVNDSHSTMTNLLIEDLHPKANLITGGRKPLSMVESLDETFAGAIFAGYHARAGQPGVMSHTISHSVRNMYINDVLIGEIGLNAYVAGHFGVPVIMVAGDDCASHETNELMPSTVTAAVKESISRSAVKSLSPVKSHQLLRKQTSIAINNRMNIPPLTPPKDPILRIEFTNYGEAENAALMPGCSIELDTTIVRFKAKDMVEVYRAMLVMVRLAGQTTYC